MPLILNKDSRVWFGDRADEPLGALTAFAFDSSDVEGAETSVQVALVGWWLIAEGGHTVQPGFWTFTGSDCEHVTEWCEAIETEQDYGNFSLLALADFLWIQQTDEAKDAFADPFPANEPIHCPVCGAEMVMDYDGGELVCSSDECDARQAIERAA